MAKPQLTVVTGFHPVITARQGQMLGRRNPLDGPVFGKLQDAVVYSIGVMAAKLSNSSSRTVTVSFPPWKVARRIPSLTCDSICVDPSEAGRPWYGCMAVRASPIRS